MLGPPLQRRQRDLPSNQPEKLELLRDASPEAGGTQVYDVTADVANDQVQIINHSSLEKTVKSIKSETSIDR